MLTEKACILLLICFAWKENLSYKVDLTKISKEQAEIVSNEELTEAIEAKDYTFIVDMVQVVLIWVVV